MANRTFDRTIINTRERPISADINQAQSQLDRTIRDVLLNSYLSRSNTIASVRAAQTPINGFLGDGFYVRGSAGMQVVVSAGVGFALNGGDTPSSINGATGTDDLALYKPLLITTDQTLAVPVAPSSGSERYDIIEVATDRRAENPTSRDVFDLGANKFSAQVVQKTLAFAMDSRSGQVTSPASSTVGLSYKIGTSAPTGTATVPSTTSGYLKVAEIYIAGGATALAQNTIRDTRRVLFPNNVGSVALVVNQTPGTPDVVSATSVMAPAGIAVAVRSTAPSGGPLRVYVVGGGGDMQFSPTAATSASANNNYVARVGLPAQSTFGGSEQSALAALGVSVALGQSYWSVDIAQRLFAVGDSAPSSWTVNFAATLRY